jgi:hypothetical protein
MLRTICATALLFASLSANANTYNIGIGQSADLQQGDVALVRDGSGVSAVTCGGAGTPTLPARQDFQITREARFPDFEQGTNDALRSLECSINASQADIRQAINDSLYAARETCFAAGYHNCAQPMVTDQQYGFYVRGFAGNYTCQVVARVIGTQP